ncbi:hypothetical protein I4U23_021687 [Adineta vaga]|nr:hypothetical protein I4U23_021687 [Adineta vaga]
MSQEHKQSSTSPFDCAVCGAYVYGNNSPIRICLPCKSFFRRHAFLPPNTLKCNQNGRCNIEAIRRYFSSSLSSCRACRLEKCLSVGMDKNFLRLRSASTPPLNNINNILLKTSSSDERIVSSTKQIDNESLMFTRPRCSSDVSDFHYQADLLRKKDYFIN